MKFELIILSYNQYFTKIFIQNHFLASFISEFFCPAIMKSLCGVYSFKCYLSFNMLCEVKYVTIMLVIVNHTSSFLKKISYLNTNLWTTINKLINFSFFALVMNFLIVPLSNFLKNKIYAMYCIWCLLHIFSLPH